MKSSKRPSDEDRLRLICQLVVHRPLRSVLDHVFYAFDSDELLARLLHEAHTASSSMFYDPQPDGKSGYVAATMPTLLRAVRQARAEWQAERAAFDERCRVRVESAS